MPRFHPLRLAAAALAAAPLAAFAAGSHDGGHGDGGHGDGGHGNGGHGSGGRHDGAASAIGAPGAASEVSRSVEVTLHDNYYEPETISAEAGETIRFRLRNAGELVHEFNIGAAAMHAAHQDEMMEMMRRGVLAADHIDRAAAERMQASMGRGLHDDPNSVLLEPGETAEILWTFPQDPEIDLEFACNVPGHYQSGMVGAVTLER